MMNIEEYFLGNYYDLLSISMMGILSILIILCFLFHKVFSQYLYETIAETSDRITDMKLSSTQYSFLYYSTLFLATNNILGLFLHYKTFSQNMVTSFIFCSLGFLFVIIEGIKKKGWNIFSIFLPAGIPNFVKPIIFPIEVISFFIRPFTLTIRLFMNILMGHIMLHVIHLIGNQPSFLFKALSLFLTLIIMTVELFTALLQSYIYLVMISGYLKDVLKEH